MSIELFTAVLVVLAFMVCAPFHKNSNARPQRRGRVADTKQAKRVTKGKKKSPHKAAKQAVVKMGSNSAKFVQGYFVECKEV